MVIRKKKKVLKYRGKRSYGYGSHKSHRGGGSRGGRGKAGMHKHKWSYTVKFAPGKYGKRGFKPIDKKEIATINVSELERICEGRKEINLGDMGIDKVLGKGRIGSAIEVMAKSFSKKAAEKIEAAGGKVVVFGEPEEEAEEDIPEEVSEEEVRERAA
jgi:large subunit ribosomal protein L15